MPRREPNPALRPAELELLEEVLLRQAPGEAEEYLQKARLDMLTSDERSRLLDLINDEFMATGINSDYEPNARGYKLENLLDAVNGQRLPPR